MRKKLVILFFAVLLLFSCCGCSATTQGASLYGFVQRMNKLEDSYNLSGDGYIIDKENKTFSKYFTFNEKNLMLTFSYNEKNELYAMSIVSDNITADDTLPLGFIKNCIYAFLCNDALTNELFESLNFDKAILTKDINTRKKKIGNTEILIDVTEIGTVITVLQNTP